MTKYVAAIAAALACMAVSAQDITMEEMDQLDQWRAQYAAKGVQLKPEDEVKLLQRLRAMKAMNSSLGGQQSGTVSSLRQQQPALAAIQAPNAALTEQDLRKQLDTLPVGKPLSSFSYMRDGLMFNGLRYADPEGKTERFALDPDSSTVAYVVSTGNTGTVKVGRLGTGSDPIAIGKLVKDGSRYSFQTVTGKTLAGDLFFPMTDGALLVRDSVGFKYTIGEGTKQIDFPAGWSPAPLQRGNASTTGWFLLEKDTTEEKKNPFAVFKSIGEAVGVVAARMDYALFNLSTKALIPFEISTEGKSVASYSQCRRSSNGLVNMCDQMRTYDSIWKPDGTANTTHYFWAIDWQQMQGKSIAVAMEKSMKEVNGYDLSGTKRVNLLQRTMGINQWNMRLVEEGKYQIIAQLGFEKSEISDVATEMQTRPDTPRKQ